MMAAAHIDVIDLASSDDASSTSLPPPASSSSSSSRHGKRKKNEELKMFPPVRRSRRLLGNRSDQNGENGVNGDNAVANGGNDGRDNLATSSKTKAFIRLKLPSSPTRWRRPKRDRSRPNDQNEDLDDEVEILDVSSAAGYAAAGISGMRQSTSRDGNGVNGRMSSVDRIREVFPLVSRAKAGMLLAMARVYCSSEDASGDDPVIPMVLMVLAEDPSGISITEASFAAAALAGGVAGGAAGNISDNRGKNSMHSDRGGRSKVAQLECQCCYVEHDFEDMVSCRDEGHLFCKTCLQRHTETRVFGLGNFGKSNSAANGQNHQNNQKDQSDQNRSHEILCMHPSGCNSGFVESHLRRALSDQVMKKYDELQFAAVIEKANMKDISKCPKCQFIAFMVESNEENRGNGRGGAVVGMDVFHCSQCQFKSCRKCGEEAHPGITCEEVETKEELDGRKAVEEAMSSAKFRTCPKPLCRKKFLKTDGCNKIVCACGAFVCYVCRKEIPKSLGYKHFCQTPHCNHASCNMCPLYTAKEEELDKKAVKEAGVSAAKSVLERSQMVGGGKAGGGSDGRRAQVHVDVNSLLKDPPRRGGRKRGR